MFKKYIEMIVIENQDLLVIPLKYYISNHHLALIIKCLVIKNIIIIVNFICSPPFKKIHPDQVRFLKNSRCP